MRAVVTIPVLALAIAMATANTGARAQDAAANALPRGEELVVNDGACGACHTPKTDEGDDVPGRDLQGYVMDGWLAPDITGDPARGLGEWSEADIAAYLKTGANRFDIASGPMVSIVQSVTASWSDEDLAAVAAYLQSLGQDAPPAPSPIAANDPGMTAGKAIYADRCSACHISSGVGAERLFPRLAGSSLVRNEDPSSLIRVVLAGSRAGATDAAPTAPAMPSFAWNLSDQEVADVLTYVRNDWGNAAAPVTSDQVGALRQELAP